MASQSSEQGRRRPAGPERHLRGHQLRGGRDHGSRRRPRPHARRVAQPPQGLPRSALPAMDSTTPYCRRCSPGARSLSATSLPSSPPSPARTRNNVVKYSMHI